MLSKPTNKAEAKAEAAIQFIGGSLVFSAFASSFTGSVYLGLFLGILIAVIWSIYCYQKVFSTMVKNENLRYFLDMDSTSNEGDRE